MIKEGSTNGYLYVTTMSHGNFSLKNHVRNRNMIETSRVAWLANPLKVAKGHFTHKPRAVTMRLCEPKRKCPKAVPTHLQNHAVWSRTLK